MNWVEFLEAYKIDYTTRGSNLSRGWLGLQCPFCGDDDPSMHLGINPITKNFTCWRDATHRGNPPKLIAKLLSVSYARACVLAVTYGHTNPDSFDAPVPGLKPVVRHFKATLPTDFLPIVSNGLTHKFWLYLKQRGFDKGVIPTYNLRAAITGKYAGRLIIPVYNEHGLVGWQGRALNVKRDTPRYKTSSSALVKNLFNYNNVLGGGSTLCICEGPFDALKVDYYGQNDGIRAVCLFGVQPSEDQILMLAKLKDKFNRLLLLLDADGPALAAAYNLSDWIKGIEFGNLPLGVKDPGELSPEQVKNLI